MTEPVVPKNKIKFEDLYAVVISFIFYFCVLGSYYVMRPMRDQLAAEVGSAKLPLFFAATLAATLVLTPIFSWIVSRFPRRITMPLVYLLFIICQLLFIPLFESHQYVSVKNLGLIFFVWVSVFNLFVVSVFWSFMTDIWSDEQARDLFPIIALGGTAGAIAGPMITRSLVGIIGSSSLLLISAALLLAAIVCVVLLGRWAHQFGVHRLEVGNEEALGGGILDGLKQVYSNVFIRNMSIIMLLTDAIGTIAYSLITDYSGATFPNNPIAQTRFAATMDLSSNIIQIFVQLTVTRWILMRFGAGIIFVIWSAIIVFACVTMTFIPNPFTPLLGTLPYAALVMIVARALAHAMLQPARETLYTLVPRELRYKGKNAIDTVVWRAGDVVSLFSINAFRSVGINLAEFGLIWAALAATSGWIGWNLSNRVERGDFEIRH